MRYCPKCKALIFDEEIFCPKCGVNIDAPVQKGKLVDNVKSIDKQMVDSNVSDNKVISMNKIYKTPIVTSIVMLILVLFAMPEGYFTLLRIIVFGTAIYLVFTAKNIRKLSWAWTMGFIAILFNPFVPIYFKKWIWHFIDVFVALTFVISIFALSGEGAAKSLFQTKAFKVFMKWALIVIGCTIITVVIYYSALLGKA